MRTAEEIAYATKPMFDRMSDGLKVVGSGNSAGLVGMIAALNTVHPEHLHTVALLKPTAVRKTNTGGRAEIRYVSRKADCDACTLRAASGFGYLRLDLAA